MKIKTTHQSVLTFLFHEILVNGLDNSGFQRKSAKPYKHDLHLFTEYLNVIYDLKESVASDFYDFSKNRLFLTFDDGGKSNLIASNILEQFDFRGIFFVSTDFLNKKYFLTTADLKMLQSRGHLIGSHSHTHPNIFRNLTYREMLNEWKVSKKILEEILENEVLHCSVPGGDANKQVYESALEAGYKFIFDSEPITNIRVFGNALVIGRICPKNHIEPQMIRLWINEKGLMKLRLTRSIKNTLKKIAKPIYTFNRKFDIHEED